ncbi:MAG: hypothetical protein E7557_09645 [Ruminococcaceae bacterium]|nr:hypothetical protein [Oscillospiraceae bacterium]
MANCPHCFKQLHFWNIKAECPYCGVNIPNYDWENMLEADAKKAEAAWAKFRIFTGNFKSSLFGNRLRIARFVFTFVPLIVLILPVASYIFNLPFLSESTNKVTLLDFTLNKLLNLNWGSLLNLTKLDEFGVSFAMIFIALLLLYLAVVFGVLNFVFILISAPSLKATVNCVLCAGSALCFILSPILYSVAVNNFSSLGLELFTGNVHFGIFVGIILFTLNFVLNFITNKSMKIERAKTC